MLQLSSHPPMSETCGRMLLDSKRQTVRLRVTIESIALCGDRLGKVQEIW